MLTFDPYLSSVQSLPHGTSAPTLPCLALLGTTFPTCLDHNLLTLDLSGSEHACVSIPKVSWQIVSKKQPGRL